MEIVFSFFLSLSLVDALVCFHKLALTDFLREIALLDRPFVVPGFHTKERQNT